MKIKFEGKEKLKAKLIKWKNTKPKILDAAMDDTADAVFAEANRLCPVDTGFLRRSIGLKLKPFHKKIVVAAPYAKWIEFGKPIGGTTRYKWKKGKGKVPRDTVPKGPRPYLRPAFQTQTKRLEDFYEKRNS